jgi:hypothetical protein
MCEEGCYKAQLQLGKGALDTAQPPSFLQCKGVAVTLCG